MIFCKSLERVNWRLSTFEKRKCYKWFVKYSEYLQKVTFVAIFSHFKYSSSFSTILEDIFILFVSWTPSNSVNINTLPYNKQTFFSFRKKNLKCLLTFANWIGKTFGQLCISHSSYETSFFISRCPPAGVNTAWKIQFILLRLELFRYRLDRERKKTCQKSFSIKKQIRLQHICIRFQMLTHHFTYIRNLFLLVTNLISLGNRLASR